MAAVPEQLSRSCSGREDSRKPDTVENNLESEATPENQLSSILQTHFLDLNYSRFQFKGCPEVHSMD
jgi:hypothetical protein